MKKIFALVMVVSILGGIVAGCSGGADASKTDAPKTDAPKADDAKKE